MPLLLQIVLTFMKIGSLAFGGGYAAIPLIQEQVVEVNGWMTNAEFMNVLAMDELTPGPIAINCATFVGVRMAGVAGGICATLGTIIPPCIVCFILAKLYFKYRKLDVMQGAISGLKCMVVALVTCTTISLMKSSFFTEAGEISVFPIIIFFAALFVLKKFKPEPLLAILASGAIGLIYSLITAGL